MKPLYCITALLLALSPPAGRAQAPPPLPPTLPDTAAVRPVTYHGWLDLGWRRTFGLPATTPAGQPPDYLRAHLRSTLSLYGLPLNVGGTWTTEQAAWRQPINALSIGLDGPALRRALEDRARRDALRRLPALGPGGLPALPDAVLALPSPEEARERAERRLGQEAARRLDSLRAAAAAHAQAADSLDAGAVAARARARAPRHLAAADTLAQAAAAARHRADSLQTAAAALYARADVGYRRALDAHTRHRRHLDSLRALAQAGQLPPGPEALAGLPLGPAQGAWQRALRRASRFERLQVGRFYATQSPFTLEGAPVTGLDVAFRPGPAYVSVTGSRNFRQASPPDTLPFLPVYARDLWAVGAGYGGRDENHLHVNMMYAQDRDAATSAVRAQLGQMPQENAVAGLEGQWGFLEDRLSVGGEVATALHSRDIRARPLAVGDVGAWARGPVHHSGPRWSDVAADIRTAARPAENTQVAVRFASVGPGYRTLGNPFLRVDYRTLQADVEQALWKRRLRPGISFSHETTNLLKLNDLTVETLSGGGRLSYAQRGLPAATGAYTFTRMAQRSARFGPFAAATDSRVWTGALSHAWKTGPVRWQAAYALQHIVQTSYTEALAYRLTAHQYTQNVGWKKLRGAVQATRTVNINTLVPTVLNTLGGSLGHRPAPWLDHTVAFQWSRSEGLGGRTLLAYDARAPLLKWLTLEARAEWNRVRTSGPWAGFWVVQAGLSANW